MKLSLNHRLQSPGLYTEADARALLTTARALAHSGAARGRDSGPLKGKNLAVLCSGAGSGVLEVPATALGARVSHLKMDPALLEGDDSTARMIARLYDAVECDALNPEAASRLQQEIGIPVYAGLSRPDHPLGLVLRDAKDLDRAYLLQALLVHTIA